MTLQDWSKGRKKAERPDPCVICNSATWWNGTRIVRNVQQRDGGVEPGIEEVRLRVKCSRPDCPRRNWTVYPEDAYPNRGFRLGVVVSAVSAVLAGERRYEVATEHQCCGDTVRRWTRWIESLVGDIQELAHSCTRLASDRVVGARPINALPSAGGVLHLLDRFTGLLCERGVTLPQPQAPGLVRMLVYLLRRSREIFWLTKQSPPFRARMEAVCL